MMDALDARLHRIGSSTSAQSSGYTAETVRWSTCAACNRPQTRRGTDRAQAGSGRTAQRRPSEAIPRPPRVRRAARHRDVLPNLPGALARYPRRPGTRRRRARLRRGSDLPTDRGAIRPPAPAAVTRRDAGSPLRSRTSPGRSADRPGPARFPMPVFNFAGNCPARATADRRRDLDRRPRDGARVRIKAESILAARDVLEQVGVHAHKPRVV